VTKEVECSNRNIMIAIVMTRFGGGDDIKVVLNAQASSCIK